MEFFKNHPFIRLIIPFVIGILVQFYLPQSMFFICISGGVFLLAFLLVSRFWLAYNWHYIKGFFLFGALLFIAMFVTFQAFDSNVQQSGDSNETWFMGQLLEIPIEKQKVYSSQLDVVGIKVGDNWKKEDIRIWLYFEKDSLVGMLKAGQLLAFKTKLNNKVFANNPFGFNFENYLKLKQIDYTLYVKSGNWSLVSDEVTGIKQQALNVRARLISIYESVGITGDELAVLSALTLGYKSSMDARIRNAYAGAGASHILAVSGMHVGILYSVFMLLFAWLKFFKKFRKYRFLLIASLLWAYAFITGLSPSVCRASTMFTFILFGLMLNKRVNIYNSLAASAFLLLFFKPLLLFDLGFQLSYVAVAGIVFFQPRIYRMFYFKQKWLDWLWGLTSVSIAAQLVTSPVTLYHFHQFPTYFWLSNMVVIVGATLLLYGALLVLAFSKVPIVVGALGWALKNLVYAMNVFVTHINKLPMAVVSNIPMHKGVVLLLYLLLICFAAWVILQQYRYLIGTLLLFLFWSVYTSFQKIGNKNQHCVCVYQVSQASAIQFVSGNASWWFLSDSVLHPKIKPLIRDANLFWSTRNNNYYKLQSQDSLILGESFVYKSGFWQLANCRGYFLNKNANQYFRLTDSLALDLLIVSGKQSVHPEIVPTKLSFKLLVIDGSVPIWQQNDWLDKGLNNRLYFTSKEGAFLSLLSE
jgi:competence protein ComEC